MPIKNHERQEKGNVHFSDLLNRPILAPETNQKELNQEIKANRSPMSVNIPIILNTITGLNWLKRHIRISSTAASDTVLYQRDMMAAINDVSLENAEILANKYNFTEWLSSFENADLGFDEPKQTLLKAHQSQETVAAQINATFGKTELSHRIRIKPLEGNRGRGQEVLSTRQEVFDFIAVNPQETYVVQENKENLRYFRYVAYLDKKGNMWRMAEGEGRELTGDGKTTFADNVKEMQLSRWAKGILYRRAKREKIPMLQEGEKKLYNFIPASEETLTQLDQPMTALIDRIQQKFGSEARLFCFDLGLSPNGKLTVHEFQLPFLMLGYPQNTPHGIKRYAEFHRLVQKELGKDFLERMRKIRESTR